jgi:hypothetical protein
VRPEVQLILRCCSVDGGDGASALSALATTADFDWRWFEDAVLRNGVAPVLARALALVNVALPDAGVQARRRIAIAAQANEMRNRHLVDELMRVLARFEADGIAALAFKGPTLAAMAYGDIALRAFADLDILVHRADLKRAVELLVADGYGLADGTARQVDPSILTAFDSGFEAGRGEDRVDLHWRIRRRRFHFFPDDERIWARSIALELEGRRVRTFAPADLALYVCVHASKHGWASLQRVADIARIVARCEIDLDELVSEARRIGCGRMVLLGLMLANELLGAPVAPAILERARTDAAVEGAKRAIVEALFSAERIESEVENYRGIAVRLMNPGDRARYWWWRAITPTMGDWEFLPLPRRFYSAYFLIRPVRLALDFARNRTPQHSRRVDESAPKL